MLNHAVFDEQHTLHQLKHYLPQQAPLKDFIHHNTLHAFQQLPFHKALQQASETFGYKLYLGIHEYIALYKQNKINPLVLQRIIADKKGKENVPEWENRLLRPSYTDSYTAKIGMLRNKWKVYYKVNLDKTVHPLLFRLVGSYLDQGISIWKFPVTKHGFLSSVRELERNSFISIFKKKRAKQLLQQSHLTIKNLLDILVGKETLYEQYLFDQQFAHPGWAGMAAVLEERPECLLDARTISLSDFIILELLLEIDALDSKLGEDWEPLGTKLKKQLPPIFEDPKENELFEVYALWQEAYEWTYYDQVLRGMQLGGKKGTETVNTGGQHFQAMFCIDDRECSIRRHIEKYAPNSQTFGTAGFFNAEFYFQPEHGKFYTKVCPAPVTPGYLIKETEAGIRHKKDAHFSRHSQGLLAGWFIAQTMGFWSAIRLAVSIFKPTVTPAMVSSFNHMDPKSKLGIESKKVPHKVHGMQEGFTVDEMATRMEGLLKSIGLVNNFAPIIYVIGHGASSVNNTHYAGYDCGACSGRAGSVNARVAAYMGNHAQVRAILRDKGIDIPDTTWFIGGLHDTTCDEIRFFDTDNLSAANEKQHTLNGEVFEKALDDNAKERSRRFLLTDSGADAQKVHREVKLRALSLFEPRPEWNHATNALCIVGRRESNRHLFFDRRAFLNSYDYSIDPEGNYLLNIMKAVAPVCGGINLEYYFSHIDNYRLGAGTKLPHNVMGLIGVANGMDGDLRPGLPRQMINIHDPVRLLVIVEHSPQVVLDTLQKHPPTYEWFLNNWVHLVAFNPGDKRLYCLTDGVFVPYHPITEQLNVAGSLDRIFETEAENLPVTILS